MKCRMCHKDEIAFEFIVPRENEKYAYTDQRRGDYAKYVVCGNCRGMLLDNSPDYQAIYTDGTYYSVDGDPATFLYSRFQEIINLPDGKSDTLERVERIKAFFKTQPQFHTPKKRRVCDIGSGMGVFLYKFLEEGWEGTAVDPEPNACVHMNEYLPGVHVIEGSITDLEKEDKYDLITLNRVLEHIYDHFLAIRAARKHLKEDGVLYLELPDALSYFRDGPANLNFGWPHYSVYSPESLLSLTSQCGFEMVAMKREIVPSGKSTLYGFFELATVPFQAKG